MNSRRLCRRDRDTVKRTWSRGWHVATLGRLVREADFARNARAGIAPARRLIILHQGGDALRPFRARLSRASGGKRVREMQPLILAYCPSVAVPLAAVLVRSCRPTPEIVPFDETRIDAHGVSGRPDAVSAIRLPPPLARFQSTLAETCVMAPAFPIYSGAISSDEEERRRRRRDVWIAL